MRSNYSLQDIVMAILFCSVALALILLGTSALILSLRCH